MYMYALELHAEVHSICHLMWLCIEVTLLDLLKISTARLILFIVRFVKLICLSKVFCLPPSVSHYTAVLSGLSHLSLRLIEVSMNKLLRILWCLPMRSHLSIVHCAAQIDTISDIVFYHSLSLLPSSLRSPSPLAYSVFSHASRLVYTFIGYNNLCGSKHLVNYSSSDFYWYGS